MQAAGNSGSADWAVLTIGGSLPSTGYFGVKYVPSSLVNKKMVIRGYPGEKGHRLYSSHQGAIFNDSNGMLSYYMDTTGGMSGSPVYSGNYIYAIHSGGVPIEQGSNIYLYNKGVKISEQLFTLIGGIIPGGGEFTDGDPDFTDGTDPGFTDSTDPGFTDGN